jgi:methyl-accepting chemotaxis protein
MVTEPTYNPDSPGEPNVGRRLVDAALSLKCKATGLVVVLMLAVSASVSGYLLRSSSNIARSEHGIQMVQMASMLAKAAATRLGGDGVAGLQQLAGESANGAPLLYVIFSDADGRQLAVAEHGDTSMLRRLDHDSAERVPVPGRPVFRSGTDTIPVFLYVTYPITSRASGTGDRGLADGASPMKLLGYVRTGMIANNWQETMSSTLDLVIGVGILAAMAAIPLGFLLVRRIVLPLEGLGQMMIRFSQGELDVRSPVRRRDEIGRLSGVSRSGRSSFVSSRHGSL